jgi:uncharacterized membrane protein
MEYRNPCRIPGQASPLKLAMPMQWKQVVLTVMRWAAAWAVVGLLVGVLMMLGKVPPIAEPGAPRDVWFYAFWIPLGGGVGALFGLLLGLLYACLLAVFELLSPLAGSTQNFMANYGRRLVCGAIAGGAIGCATFRNPEGLYVVALGVISAAVAGYLNRPSKTTVAN